MLREIIKNKTIFCLVILFFSLLVTLNLYIRSENQYVYLAHSFIAGQTSFLSVFNPADLDDVVPFKGNYYWHMGPFPAVLLTPFVFLFGLFNQNFYQGQLQLLLVFGVFLMCYEIARKFNFDPKNSLYLAFAFCFSSVFQQVALIPWVWYFAQVVTVILTLFSINEYFSRRRLWVIGVLMAAVIATRVTAGMAVVFFILMELTDKTTSISQKLNSVIKLTIPILFAGTVLLWYNYARFGNIFDNGFKRSNEGILPESYRYEQVNYGLFQFRNFPTNVYYYFVKTLDPVLIDVKTMHGNSYVLKSPFVTVNYPGTSFFIVSPVFLYIFRAKLKNMAKMALASAMPILIVLLVYYWPGWRQVGPRYMLDLLPLGYIVLLYSFPNKQLSWLARGTIIISAFFNVYLLTRVF